MKSKDEKAYRKKKDRLLNELMVARFNIASVCSDFQHMGRDKYVRELLKISEAISEVFGLYQAEGGRPVKR